MADCEACGYPLVPGTCDDEDPRRLGYHIVCPTTQQPPPEEES